MPITINGSGTITGASTLATTVVSPTLTTPIATTTIGVGNTTPSASGSGISFPATQSASSDANTLDDYEEGTWTPTVQGVSSAGTATYSVQLGSYTKVGNLVSILLYISYSSGTGSGQLRVGGLPFANGSVLGAATIYLDNIAYAANSYPQCVVNTSAITMDFYLVNGGSSSAITYDAAGTIILSTTYRT